MKRTKILVAAVVVAGLAGAYFLYPMILAMREMRPLDQPFEAYPRPPAPNYADPANWAALPGKEHPDAADMVPAGESVGDRQDDAEADVFYIHPTTYRGRENWNQDLALKTWNDFTDQSVINRQAAAFNGCCRVYAPRYRQAATSVLYARDGGADKARALAYEDVKRAFQFYIDHYNNGRPFILAGHSQGTFHIQKLIEEVLDGSAIRPQLVAIYAIGIGFPVGMIERTFRTIPPCAKPDDTGCIISWNTFTRDGDGAAMAKGAAARYEARFKTKDGAEQLCINPLTFALDQPDAPASANLGSLPGTTSAAPLPALKPGLIGARCEGGVLYADAPEDDEDFQLVVLPGGNLHFHDFDFFFKNIRDNAILRVDTYSRSHFAR